MSHLRNAQYAAEPVKLTPSSSGPRLFLWDPTSPHHDQEWTCLPKSSRPSPHCPSRPVATVPHVEVELSGGPCDGARYRVPAHTVVVNVQARQATYKDGGRLTLDGATVFTFAE